MDALEPGSRAPSFKLKRDGGGTLSLAEFKGRNLVIYFYPKADVIGVSADPVEAQDRFKKKHRIDLPLGSDPEHDMLTAYEAWGEKSLYGRKFMGVIRKTYLIDDKGRIARIWPKVRVDGHAADVLTAAKAL